MPDHERARLDPAALRPGRRRAAEEQPLQDGRRGPRILAYPVEPDVREVREPARYARGHPAHQARERRPEREHHEQRGERQRAPEQRVVQDRHLDHEPTNALGREDCAMPTARSTNGAGG